MTRAKMELQLNLATKSEEVEATLAKHMEKSDKSTL